MKNVIILLLGLLCLPCSAQRVSREYRDVPLSAALKELNSRQERYVINFIYNELEDFRVTTSVHNLPVPDAVRQLIGFYPVQVTQVGSVLLVECMQKTDSRYKGRIVDENRLPAEFANVALLSPADSSIIGSGVSNADGYFVIPCSAPGVIVRISYVGYKTIVQPCNSTDMGTFSLQPEQQLVRGVTVKGYRPQYKMTRGGLAVDVEHSLLSRAGTAGDVLRMLPRVNVNVDGEVSVFAKGTPEIYINNKLVRDNAELTELKSTDIRDVEVITSPGARYNAAVKSVIRIRTKRTEGDGLGIRTETNVKYNSRPGGYEEVDLKYRHKGLELFGNAGISTIYGGEDNTVSTELQLPTHITRVVTGADTYYRSTSANAKVGFSLDIGRNSSAGAYYSVARRLYGKGHSVNNKQEVWRDGNYQGLSDEDIDISTPFGPQHELNAYYMGRAGKLGIDANATYLWRKSGRTDHWVETSPSLGNRTVSTYNMRHNHMSAFKLALDYPVGSGSVSAGVEYTHTNTHDTYENPEQYVDNSVNDIRETNLAPFVSYSVRLGRWSMDAGLRYEHVKSDYYAFGTREAEPSRTYNNWFPNLSAGWNGRLLTVQLSYARKINRPSYLDLRNNVQYLGRYLYEAGNPYLRPVIEHNVELNAVYRWLSVTAGYNYDNDYIGYFASLYNGEETELVQNRNFSHSQNIYASVVIAPKFGFYQPMLEVDLAQSFFHATRYGGLRDLNDPSASIRLNNKFVVSARSFFTVNMEYNSEASSDFVKTKASGSLDVSYSLSLLQRALLLNVYAFDILKTRRSAWTQYGQQVVSSKDSYEYTRRIGITLTYNFNLGKSKYKGTGAGNEEKKRL